VCRDSAAPTGSGSAGDHQTRIIPHLPYLSVRRKVFLLILPPQIASLKRELVCYPAGHLKTSPDNGFPRHRILRGRPILLNFMSFYLP
jgi:hypothetical protein